MAAPLGSDKGPSTDLENTSRQSIFEIVDNIRGTLINPTTPDLGMSNCAQLSSPSGTGQPQGSKVSDRVEATDAVDHQTDRQPSFSWEHCMEFMMASQRAQCASMEKIIGSAISNFGKVISQQGVSGGTEQTRSSQIVASTSVSGDGTGDSRSGADATSGDNQHGGARDVYSDDEGLVGDDSESDCFDSLQSNLCETKENPEDDNIITLMADFHEFFGEDDDTSESLREDLAKSVNEGMTKSPHMGKLKEVMGRYKRPKNCEALRVPKANEEIWQQAKPATRTRDLRAQQTQGLMVKAMIPLIQLTDALMSAIVTKSEVDIKDTLMKATDSIRLLAGAHGDLNTKRREGFKPDLKGPYKNCVLLCQGRIQEHICSGMNLENASKTFLMPVSLGANLAKAHHGNLVATDIGEIRDLTPTGNRHNPSGQERVSPTRLRAPGAEETNMVVF
ncbi:uncharacterized protein LOC124279372 [Haliotis rubra]|uniref:uncharacterized protein LOC124279372 n=1 Tax=Haliotis rubra TaxID=36100 RepID=UPI001EE51377|nr:uncharacterized protein LOC124279372 [Haliotis rubra]